MVAGRAGVGTNQENVRRHNLGTALGHVHVAGRVSRAELTARMGLNRSTIAGLVSELESLGLASQGKARAARAGAGRPSVDVLAGSRAHVIAVDVRVDGLVVARVGLGGVVEARASGPVAPHHDPDTTVESIAELVHLVTKDAPRESAQVGVGVGVPGMIQVADGVVRLAPNLAWVDVPLARMLAERLGTVQMPVLANDADLGALAEHLRGAAVGVDDLVYLSGEIGVGAGVITGGVPLGGAGGYAGEIGHIPFQPDGPACHCGAYGCWETLVGGVAIAEAIDCPPERIASLGEVLDAITDVTPGLRQVAEHLGTGIAGLVNVINPSMVVMGGFLRALLPLVQDDVLAALDRQALRSHREQVRIVAPGLGGDSVLLGAAELAFAELLADPVSCLEIASA